MKKILLVSPHFDDAVLSAGQFMADRTDTDVVTVYGGLPSRPDKVLTPYDEKCGFDTARNAVGSRVRENDAALALLESRAINLDFPDSQYVGIENTPKPFLSDIVAELQRIVDVGHYEFIMAPLGLGHPDHIQVTEAVMSLKTNKPIYLWEDLPLRVVEPQTVTPRLKLFHITLDQLMQPATTDTKIAKKIRALSCYKSQINTGILDPYVMYVPERFWQIQ